MEGCSKTSDDGAVAVPGLPDDPLVEILSRVPAKSVCRFKCVSKAWCDLITHPDHRKKLRQAMQGLFVQTAEVNDNEITHISFSFIDLTVRSVPLNIDPGCFSFLAEMSGIKTAFHLDSCNGLILFRHRQKPPHSNVSAGRYIVCNPTTKQWLDVPACGSRAALSHTCLAFDPAVSSHFHLVQFQMPDVAEDVQSLHVYSSETGTWSQNQINEQKEQGQSEGWHHQFTLYAIDHQCAFVNGFLHLIVWDLDGRHMLAVDQQGKARRMVAMPGMADGRPGHSYVCYFGESQGHLHCVTLESPKANIHDNDKLSTWFLQNYDTQEWVLKNTVNSSVVFGETKGMPEFRVVGIHHDCNVIFYFHQLSSCKLMAYDMDRKEVSVIAIFEDHKEVADFARYIPYFSESPALTNKY